DQDPAGGREHAILSREQELETIVQAVLKAPQPYAAGSPTGDDAAEDAVAGVGDEKQRSPSQTLVVDEEQRPAEDAGEQHDGRARRRERRRGQRLPEQKRREAEQDERQQGEVREE